MESSQSKQAARLTQPVRITEQVWPEGTVPVVSVFCITYNHVKFIRDAIEGFLMQETTFPVEIFIHDDASTDRTAEIVKEYAAKYPQLFWTVFQTENQWSKGTKKILFDYLAQQRGEFIAMCEGDDYWTSQRKLQKQVEALESKPQASGCFARASIASFSESGDYVGATGPGEDKCEYSMEDLLVTGHIAQTLTVIYRRDRIAPAPEWISCCPAGDIPLAIIAASKGPLLFLDEIVGVYRVHSGGVHSKQSDLVNIRNFRENYRVIGQGLALGDNPAYRLCMRNACFYVAETQLKTGKRWASMVDACRSFSYADPGRLTETIRQVWLFCLEAMSLRGAYTRMRAKQRSSRSTSGTRPA